MEDAWQAKLPSTWPPPPPGISPLPLSPPTIAAGSASLTPVLPGGSDRAILQEQFAFRTLNLSSSWSRKAEVGNPILSLLSGHSHHLTSTLPQFPNSSFLPTKLSTNSSDIISTAAGVIPIPGLASLSENHGNDAMGNKDLSLPNSKAKLMTMCTRTPTSLNNLQFSGSSHHGADSSKRVHQEFQGNNNGMLVSSTRHEWQNLNMPANASHHHSSNHVTLPKTTPKVKSFISSQASALYSGHLHVFCLNTVGELFLKDMGLLGVLCLCHSLPMSVAKFCEHSGSSSVYPGDVVHLENGLTIAQWFQLSFGIRIPDNGNGWDWPDVFSPKNGPDASKENNFPLLLKNLETSPSESFCGFKRYGEPWNNFVRQGQSYTGAADQIDFEQSVNTIVNNAYLGNASASSNLYSKSFCGSAQCSTSAVDKSQVVRAVKETPVWIHHAASVSPLNKLEQSTRHQVGVNNANTSLCGASVSHVSSGSKKSSPVKDYKIDGGKYLSETFLGDRNGVSSNIELRLGQPSQHNQTFVGSIPPSVYPRQPDALCNYLKAQVPQPLMCTNKLAAACPPEMNKIRPLWSSPSETCSNTRLLQSANGKEVTTNHSEADLMDSSTKNSAISLFLSHLDYTEENNSSRATVNVVDECQNYSSLVLDEDAFMARWDLSEFIKNTNDVTGGKSSTNVTHSLNHCDNRKDQRVDPNRCYNILGCNSVVDNKRESEAGGIGGLGSRRCSYKGDTPSYLYPHQQSGLLNVASNVRDSKHCGKFPVNELTGHCNLLNHKSLNAVLHVATHSGPLGSQIPSKITGTNSYVSETQSSLTNKQGADNAHYSVDGNLILLDSRHTAGFSKLEFSNASTETSNQHGRLCCLSAMALHRNDNKDATAVSDELRQLPCCSIQRDAFNRYRSLHSCSNRYYAGGYKTITGKPGATGPNICCSCSGLQQRISLSCKEHDIQCPMCHPCGSDEQAMLRNGRSSKNVAAENAKYEMCNPREHICCSSRQCCCTFPSNCLPGPCISRDEPFYNTKEQCVCGKAKMYASIDYDAEDDKRLKANQPDCSRKHAIMQNDGQIAFWRDVPNRVLEHSKDNVREMSACGLKSEGIISNQHGGTAVKEFDCTYQESKSLKERHSTNAYSGPSGYSAPIVTDISVEINNVDSCDVDVRTAKFMHNSTIDEESRIENCGSSDDPLDGRELKEAHTMSVKMTPVKSGIRYIQDEEHLSVNSSNSKDLRNKKGAPREQTKFQQLKRNFKAKKRKGPIKWRSLNEYLPLPTLSNTHSDLPDCSGHPNVCLSSSKVTEAPVEPNCEMQKVCNLSCKLTSVKRKRSTLSSIKSFCWKRFKNDQLIQEDDKAQSSNHDGMEINDDFHVNHKEELAEGEDYHVDAETPIACMSLGVKSSPNDEKAGCNKKPRPIVCGNLGIISDGLNNQQKPAKILSLRLVMKKSKKSMGIGCERKAKLCSRFHRKPCPITHERSCNELFFEEELSNGSSSIINNSIVSKIKRKSLDPSCMISGSNKVCLNKNDGYADPISRTTKVINCGTSKSSPCHEGSLLRHMETRKRSLSKLMGEDKPTTKPTCSRILGDDEIYNVIEAGEGQCDKRLCSKKIVKGALATGIKWVNDSQDFQHPATESLLGTRRSSKGWACRPLLSDSDAFCCVCGSSNKDEINRLLDCNQCLIRVHQACYGVSKVPKGHWYCRPCKANSKNIVCVLCGYDGGAMTRALKSRNIVKSLLKVWKIGLEFKSMESVSSPVTSKKETLGPSMVDEASRCSPGSGPQSPGAYCGDTLKVDLQDQDMMLHIDSLQNDLQSNNTIVNGVYDPCITQWVHMVCGLWTPGTRCPNVDTMNAFDVSGASPAGKNIVCSICNRPGGACIRCRVVNCSIYFHPWCAHQKGLLQSEIEGVDDEKVGFYGRCLLHTTYQSCVDINSVHTRVESPRSKEFSCARVEGYKGRKREEGNLNFPKRYNDGRGCIVTQDQINAWIFINGQKSFLRGTQKVPCSDVDHDFRKEYIRYKQMKGWKQLVVYKSGIHALGLYTSQFIARGAMVVEYVGEIVGLRVADKREIEYQSGRKLQYKSACYFFRIDKEYIIDATRKGGIARFVNHSCLPNCVAKIISVRNEKKVIFFAERDINPGEEITYDYHFNNEDEGEKLPCFCNSKNCRRYLN
ncbi:hypothetical protein J5N97_002671 [Dioscorea zingiberensis]|uniref:Uncharacterized protein n=1 Tax=Dioscorea zingiberensis TaxID=325984 RepID=A0A9D5HPF5_9LILI|nr:hypothetical protein J5N97_002671 [Dioscorea zingiberensis]